MVLMGVLSVACVATALALSAKHIAANELPPAPMPIFAIDDETTVTDGVVNRTLSVVAVDGDKFTWRRQDGFTLVMHRNYMNLAEEESGAGRDRVVTRTDGDHTALWPLKVGNETTVHRTSRNKSSGARTKSKQTCKVVSQEEVSVPAGTFDTFKVVCGVGYWMSNHYHGQTVSWTHYHAPSIGMRVKLVWRDEENSETWELVTHHKGNGGS